MVSLGSYPIPSLYLFNEETARSKKVIILEVQTDYKEISWSDFKIQFGNYGSSAYYIPGLLLSTSGEGPPCPPGVYNLIGMESRRQFYK